MAEMMEKSADNGIDISLEKNGGLLKNIVKQGSGDDGPGQGDMVSVHYVGKLLDGTIFDSSRERGELFEFQLGKGSVIKGWDVGVATMKKGELSQLTCKPEYAYGEAGSPPKIPANATLVFEVELFSWKMEDLSPSKNGGIQRRILVQGDGYASPKEGATVDIHYVGKYEGKVFEERDVSFSIGEGGEQGIVEGVELSLQSFKRGEKSLIKLSPNFGYGTVGKPDLNIPSDAALEYEVALKSFEKVKEAWEMNSEEKLEQSEIAKNKGTELFKGGNYVKAVKEYKKVVKYMENDPDTDEESVNKAKPLLQAAYLNLAACYLKISKHQEALKACDKALELQPDNVKGLFRRGQARAGLKDYALAKENFNALLVLDPENKAAKNQIIVCNQHIKQQLDKEKETYKNMFAKFAEEDRRKEARNIKSTESGVWQNGQKAESDNRELDLDNVELLPNKSFAP